MVVGSRREMRGAKDDSGSQWTFCSVEDKKRSADTEQKRTFKQQVLLGQDRKKKSWGIVLKNYDIK